MITNFSDISSKQKKEILCIDFIVIFFLYRATFPVLKYLFIILYCGFLIYSIIFSKERVRQLLKEFVINYYLVFTLIGLFLLSVVFSDKLYLIVFKDFINMILLLSLFFILRVFLSEKKLFRLFYLNLISFTIFFALVVSILNLCDLLNILTFRGYFPKSDFLRNSLADNLFIDSNFALVPIFFGMTGAFFYLSGPKTLFQKVSLNLILLVFLQQILLSGSRRGLIVLAVIFFILLTLTIGSFIKRFIHLRNLCLSAGLFLLEIILVLFFSYLFFSQTSYKFKNSTFNLFGINNASVVKSNISSRIFRYVSAFNINISYYDLNKKIWSIKFDPSDPDSGWGQGNYKKIFPLTGKNVEIVPVGTIGYLLDSTRVGENSGDTFYSATKIGNSEVNFSEIQEASVLCYVSKDFNGDLVSILSEGNTFGNREDKYDLENKSTWQKLYISVNCKKGDASVYLILSKFGVANFKSLRGYVIFAYPQYRIINETRQNILSLICHHINNDHLRSDSINSVSRQCFRKEQRFPDSLKNTNFSNYSYCFKPKREATQFYTKSVNSTTIHQNINLAGLLSLPALFQTQINSMVNDKDPIRNWISRFVAEDTTYHGFKVIVNIDSISNRFIDLRIIRWQFAWQIFTKEYNWRKKIFGGGFNFLNWFGYYFEGDKTNSDYPHNPLISVLLYSGIVGLMIYLFFLYKVFYYYFKYIKEYPLLFIFFLITFFFSFFSGGSPFDPPIMGFFVILPFFINSIHKKDKSESDRNPDK